MQLAAALSVGTEGRESWEQIYGRILSLSSVGVPVRQ